ncbi:unnamed protein product [Owenia fusiformis]|uniref:Regulator of microtubule dynamics protein 1 n=1 Tax=Owenia fusiformis TaxID=6347 RepID=A0A8J1XZP1_OWEFU|nr:unnamed protein product [Owenia fusiformis]
MAVEGRWRLVSLNNMEEFLLKIGLSKGFRNNILSDTEVAHFISQDGNKWTIKEVSKFGTRSTSTFELGKEFEEMTVDGRQIHIVYSIDGDNLKMSQRGDFDCTTIREPIDANTLRASYTCGDAIGVMNFTKIPDGESYGEWPPSLEDLLTSNKLDDITWAGTPQQIRDVYDIMTKEKDNYKNDANFLWRYACFIHSVALVHLVERNKSKHKSTLDEANAVMQRAFELKPEDARVNKWYVTILCALSEAKGIIKEKIEKSFVIKERIDKAISLNPDDPVAYYLRGRWCLEVASLNWMQRKLAATFFATPPTATVPEGVEDLLKANEIWPQWKENAFYLAKAMIDQKKIDKAIEILQRAIKWPIVSQDDNIFQPKLLQLLYIKT